MKTLVIIPCYNEEKNLAPVIERLRESYPAADYLVVNDCSTDDSEHVLMKNGYRHLRLPVNLGIGGGVQSGFMYALENGYDIAVQMDGDGQHSPKYLPDIIRPVADGECDMCVGSRFITKEGFQSGAMRRLGIRFLSVLIFLLCGAKVKDVTSGFRAFNRDMLSFFALHYAQDYPEPEAVISAVLNGFSIKEVAVVMEERKAGKSSISPFKSVYYMLKVSISLMVYRLVLKRTKRGKNRC